jgi:hypothetical protein
VVAGKAIWIFFRLVKGSAMNCIMNTLMALIGFALCSGCTTTEITRDYHGGYPDTATMASVVTKTAAVDALQHIRLFQCSQSGAFDPISSELPVDKITESGISYGTWGTVVDRREFITTKLTRVYYHEGWQYHKDISFLNITRIVLVTDFTGGTIHLYGKYGNFAIPCGNKPEIYDRMLSALLVLCPSVK